ncbi:MAG: ABC transporter ATP-binding protein [Chloroflexi bacterium]|nr:ABC transporter ATP-binding protein [Chloroflexota bacterium]
MEAIECHGLTKRYGDITALDNLDLVVKKHSVFGFLGPNGAGKTTTVKLLTGLSVPDSGKAWVDGQEVISGDTSFLKSIGFLPDVPTFYSWMNGRQYLKFVGELHGIPPLEIEKRCDELLELVNLKKASKRKVGGYSRGMKQRLGIAQALINKPKVLILDEPTSALDPVGRRDVLELIDRLGKETTIFMSTHILSDVERVCDTVCIIDKGKMITTSSVEELRKKYARSVFEIELEGDTSALLNQLNLIDFIVEAREEKRDGNLVIRILTNDIIRAKQELPQIITISGLTLIRYELTVPSLEDIFVELVEGEGGG